MPSFWRGRELPAWLWLWLPPVVLPAIFVTAAIDRPFYQRWLTGNGDVLEWITVLLLVPAVICGAGLWQLRRAIRWPLMRSWWLALTLTCVYFGGEDINWGQQLFGWETPAFLAEINDENETNLHNISSWLDQKPRLLFELWVMAGGLVVPTWRAVRGVTYAPGQWEYWFWPTGVCVPAALFAVLSHLPERVRDAFNLPPFPVELRYSEIQEFYFALFLLLYLASARARLRAFVKP